MDNELGTAKAMLNTIHDRRKLSWEQLKQEKSYEEHRGNLELYSGISLTYEKYVEIIDELASHDKKIHTSIGSDLNDYKVSQDPYSAWQMYRKTLRDNKKWTEDSISNVERSAVDVLNKLAIDTHDRGPVKGLVVGNVQSGKTANMTGLMALAADNGFNCFIVLSGIIDKLRSQTANRIINDLDSSGAGNLSWKRIDKPSVANPDVRNTSSLDFSSKSKNRFVIVSLKNKARLRDLYNWLKNDISKQRQMKILIIDDEADQASINTKDVDSDERTAINKVIREIVDDSNFGAVNYVAYTATPFANVLNESGADSLYPKDFITLLEPAKNYIGPKQIFGIPDPNYAKGLEIVHQIPEQDREIISEIQDGVEELSIPDSMKASIDWFLLAVAAMRVQKFRKPISMLIHTDFKIDSHRIIESKLTDYFKYLKDNYLNELPKFEELYEDEKTCLTRGDFQNVMRGYEGDILNYPEWNDVKRELIEIFKVNSGEYYSHITIEDDGQLSYTAGIHICVDNSSAKGSESELLRLVYPEKIDKFQKAPAFIVIGGNTLSRGLTIEGLVSTYFLRKTDQADTLMQMARWFGFRKGYELYPRVWLDEQANMRYVFLSEMNEAMREEFANYSGGGVTPLEAAPKIKQSPSYVSVRITAKNKMQKAKPTEFNFSGMNRQTIIFSEDPKIQKANLVATQKLFDNLEQIGSYNKHTESKLYWENVPIDTILNFFSDYQTIPNDDRVESMDNLISWIKENRQLLMNWNVIYSGKGSLRSAQDGELNIGGKTLDPVKRSKKKQTLPGIINIGALRSPSDLTADIPLDKIPDGFDESKINEVMALRRDVGVYSTPQLIIYRIDGKSQANKDSRIREALDLDNDLIGLNIMIPASNKNNNNNKTPIDYVAVEIDEKYSEPLEIGKNVEEN